MSTKEREKSSGKPRRRNQKPKQRSQKPDQQQRPKPDQRDEDQIGAIVASTDAPTNGVEPLSELPSSAASNPLLGEVGPADAPLIGEVAPTDALSTGAVAPMDNFPISTQTIGPVSIRTIANAYGSYTEKSFEETSSFVEKLMAVRSFDKVIEVQTEFARQTHATFIAESQKICALYTELAKEIMKSWQGFAAKVTQAGR